MPDDAMFQYSKGGRFAHLAEANRGPRQRPAALSADETLHFEWCYLPADHEGDCRGCAACDGDPEALGLHVCGKEWGE